MTFKWGIIGPGGIARRFARGIAAVEGAELSAVASRSAERAQLFADEFSVAKQYSAYADIVADSEIDCIYVATPHPYHLEQAKLALRAGKAVLCEKPLCVNGQQVAELIQCAKENNSFLMEAMWTRCLPVMRQVHAWVTDGQIGAVKQVKASFGYNCTFDADWRLFNPALAGGALLDVGVYTIALAQRFLPGAPHLIQAVAEKAPTGVDEQCAMLLAYADGGIAAIDCAVQAQTDGNAYIHGSKGSIHIAAPFWATSKATLQVDGAEPVICEQAHLANGFEYEVSEVQRCVRAGLHESPLMTHLDSTQVMAIMDAVRTQIEVKYPFE